MPIRNKKKNNATSAGADDDHELQPEQHQQQQQQQPDTDAEAGEAGDETNAWAGGTFSDKSIRHAFIRKVYLTLMVQLAFTVAIICLFLFCEPVKKWVQANQAAYWVSYGIFVVSMMLLVCLPNVRRKVPLNYICLAIFTASLTYMTATISSFYETEIVLIAMAITTGVCLAISLFAIQTKIDFTMCTGLIFAVAAVLFLFGLSVFIAYLVTPVDDFTMRVLHCVYGGIAALLLSLLLAFDTQQVVGGKNIQLNPEEYISGALQLYLDIIYMFLTLLRLFRCCKR